MAIISGSITNGNDSIIADSANDVIDALDGNDSIRAAGGKDTISGGAGNDYLYGEDGNDSLNGGEGNDNLYGGNGNDILLGGNDNDYLYRDAGSDTINGGSGNDFYNADYSSATTGLTMTYDSLTGNGTITVGTESDKLVSIENLPYFRGTNFNDQILGTASSESSYGGKGDDTISGGAGNDYLYGEDGNDSLNGGEGNDYLYGGNGNDILLGGNGNDYLYRDAGSDKINGGSGNDSYYSADYSSATTGLTMTYDSATGNGTITVGTEIDKLVSIENLPYFRGTNFNDQILGTAGSESSYGGGGNDAISGNAGNDYLYGEDGDDPLSGGEGNDNLNGGNGNDILLGGSGNDYLLGNANNDRFPYNTEATFNAAAVGIDTIADFTDGLDKIVLDKTTFSAITSSVGTGFSIASEFAVVGSDTAAATSNADIVYNSANGKLFYNQNGNAAGFGTGAQFATISGMPLLDATDFIIQA